MLPKWSGAASRRENTGTITAGPIGSCAFGLWIMPGTDGADHRSIWPLGQPDSQSLSSRRDSRRWPTSIAGWSASTVNDARRRCGDIGTVFRSCQHGGILVVGQVKARIDAQLPRPMALSSVYNLLNRHGWRKLAPDKRHPQPLLRILRWSIVPNVSLPIRSGGYLSLDSQPVWRLNLKEVRIKTLHCLRRISFFHKI